MRRVFSNMGLSILRNLIKLIDAGASNDIFLTMNFRTSRKKKDPSKSARNSTEKMENI